jgi:hypothetical protein
VVAGGQPGLAAADDHRLEPLRVHVVAVHRRLLVGSARA